jgi:hypothetical protein
MTIRNDAPKRVSNRDYPERKCTHCKRSFIPTDIRHKYCSRQCGINASNDKRRVQNEARFQNEKLLRDMDQALEKLYRQLRKVSKKTVSERDLILHGIKHLELATQLQQNKNGLIRWFHFYGLQAVNNLATEFIICKRDKIE